MSKEHSDNIMDRYSDWACENSWKASPNHIAILSHALLVSKGLNHPQAFGLPTKDTMLRTGFKYHKKYYRYFKELIEFGFIYMIKKSPNHHQASIISFHNPNLNRTKNEQNEELENIDEDWLSEFQ